MDKMPKLIVEPSKVETSLAAKYLKDNNFQDFPSSEEFWINNTDGNTKVSLKDHPTHNSSCYQNKESFITHKDLGRQLAKKIEENEKMFCQLEYQLRSRDAADVKNSITLMCQHLQCSNAPWNQSPLFTLIIKMSEESPLHVLGCVASAIYKRNDMKYSVAIATCQTTAPLCHFFVNLCSQVGCKVPLIYIDKPERLPTLNCYSTRQLKLEDSLNENGCTAVVTEQADIDSALDALIYSSVTAPWRFRRVFVQESVYEEFKSGLAWKCERVQMDTCVDAFSARGKTFSCDRLRADLGSHSDILVEAYRTVKELFALMKGQSTPFLSVWAEGSQLSNEIALGADAGCVWLNDYASFAGPPLASLPIYEHIYPMNRVVSSPKTPVYHSTGASWWKRKDEERKDIVIKALQFHILEYSELDDELLDAALTWQRNNFVHVEDGKICFGVDRAPVEDDFHFIKVEDGDKMSALINLIISGFIVIYWCCNEKFVGLLESLERSDIPVLQYNARYNVENPLLISTKMKVVHSRFGTVFAN